MRRDGGGGGGISWWIVNDLQPSRFGPLMEVLIGGGLGLVAYTFITVALGSEEARQVKEIFMGRLKRRRSSG